MFLAVILAAEPMFDVPTRSGGFHRDLGRRSVGSLAKVGAGTMMIIHKLAFIAPGPNPADRAPIELRAGHP